MCSRRATSRHLRLPIALLIAAFCSPGAFRLQAQATVPAIPLDPIAGVVEAFHSHTVVALGDGANHGDEQSHAFRLSLIRDPRFAARVDDNLVEWENSRHQALMDRFVSGEDIADTTLRHVWQDTTEAGPIWDAPIYEVFFHAVRQGRMALVASTMPAGGEDAIDRLKHACATPGPR